MIRRSNPQQGYVLLVVLFLLAVLTISLLAASQSVVTQIRRVGEDARVIYKDRRTGAEIAVDAPFVEGAIACGHSVGEYTALACVSGVYPLEALLGSEPLRRIGALMAVDPDGRLRGIVTIDRVRRALQQATAGASR